MIYTFYGLIWEYNPEYGRLQVDALTMQAAVDRSNQRSPMSSLEKMLFLSSFDPDNLVPSVMI